MRIATLSDKDKLIIAYEKKIQKLLKKWLKEIKKENRKNEQRR